MIKDYANNQFYNNNIEAQEVWRVTQPEVDAQEAKILRVFNNTRATKADKNGIGLLELTYDIMPDLRLDDIEDRRGAVLVKKRQQPPFTERWLTDTFLPNLFKDDYFIVFLDWERLILNVSVPLDYSWQLREFNSAMRHHLPADLVFISTIHAFFVHEPTPVIPAVKTVHAVKHMATPVDRNKYFTHTVDATPVIPTAKTIHAVKHTATPVEREETDTLMYLQLENGTTIPGFIDVDGNIQRGFLKIITEEGA
ncbi:MAG: YmfQ family protein [Defluviitaleaceae bacterium]|nr:YmfQ family protein [Defluviitaleaceae bacterium]MCL2261696.1 YmfQ family protein [Defluviitaleaceae bacterium]